MKKRILIATVALALCLGTVTAFAAGPGRGFTDANGDGACDYRGQQVCANGSGCNFTDANGDGVCDYRGQQICANRSGCSFTDADGDGVCDFQSNCGHAGRGRGCMRAQ